MLDKKSSFLVILILIVGLLVTACGGAPEENNTQPEAQENQTAEKEQANEQANEQAEDKSTISIQGSSTVLPIAQKAAEDYMNSNPEINISVRGGGSGNGVAALIDNAVDIADTSRFITDKEFKQAYNNGVYPVPHRIAMDGIAVIINPNNPIQNLTLEQLKKIYTGQVSNWQELGGPDAEIVVVSRDSSSGTFEVFGEIALDGNRVVQTALMQSSNGTVKSTVADTKGGIGYIGIGYLSDNVKGVKVNGVKATNQTVANGEFPISRPLFMFTDGWPEGLTKRFINFLLSQEGQKIVEEQGYVPLY